MLKLSFHKMLAIFCVLFAAQSFGGDEKPVQHIKLDDVTTADQAKEIFLSDTAKLKAKIDLNAKALHEIHYITYSLEKSIAYYANNTRGEMKALAEKMAVTVEEVHLNSENNRTEKTQEHLTTYFDQAKQFETFIK